MCIASKLLCRADGNELYIEPELLGEQGDPITVPSIIALTTNDADEPSIRATRQQGIQRKLRRALHQYLTADAQPTRRNRLHGLGVNLSAGVGGVQRQVGHDWAALA